MQMEKLKGITTVDNLLAKMVDDEELREMVNKDPETALKVVKSQKRLPDTRIYHIIVYALAGLGIVALLSLVYLSAKSTPQVNMPDLDTILGIIVGALAGALIPQEMSHQLSKNDET
ncbi:MAG: hypothetical protein AAGI92_09060 [Pseudomonadota bacterium]